MREHKIENIATKSNFSLKNIFKFKRKEKMKLMSMNEQLKGISKDIKNKRIKRVL